MKQSINSKTKNALKNKIALWGIIGAAGFAAIFFASQYEASEQTQSSQFTESANAYGLDLPGAKDGGLAWGDYDNDGDVDVLINTSSSNYDSRLYRNDGNSFSDVSASIAPGLLSKKFPRQALWADLNNDGFLDIVRNSHTGMEVYLYDDTSGKFGDGIGGVSPLYISDDGDADLFVSNGVNMEGAGVFDFDGDGDLDIYTDNHNHGIDILRNNFIDHTTGNIVNPAIASLFSHATSGSGTVLGLAQSATSGDYGASCDVNDDGWVDIFMRKQSENDFFLNQGGVFVNGVDIGEASNGDKGAVGLYDLDNDGDFDAVWTSSGGNYIFRNDGGSSWTQLTGNLSIESTTNVDGVAGGDIDNDGDIDLIFTGSSKSYLYVNDINNSSGIGAGIAFQMDLDLDFDGDADNSGNGEGVVMVDIDGDGDLDIYENKRSSDNKLWINNLYDNTTDRDQKAYINIDILENRSSRMQSGATRHAIGTNVVLKDCDGNVVSGVRDVNGGTGHGTQNPLRMHFGLPLGNNTTYLVEARYPNDSITGGSKTRPVIYKAFNPTVDGTNLITFLADEADVACSFYQSILPVEWLQFTSEVVGKDIHLHWSTGQEVNNSSFKVQRSNNAKLFEDIGTIAAKNKPQQVNRYSFVDPRAKEIDRLYYRIKQVDIDGKSSYSNVIEVEKEIAGLKLSVFPNPTTGKVFLEIPDQFLGKQSKVQVMGVDGKLMYEQAPISSKEIDLENMPSGIYFIQVRSQGKTLSKMIEKKENQ